MKRMSKVITLNEIREATKDILVNFMPLDCLADKSNDYCGKIRRDEYLKIANKAMEDAVVDVEFMKTVEFNLDFMSKHMFRQGNINKCAMDLATEYGIEVL